MSRRVPKQITREEAQRLLDKHMPDASPIVRHAVLTGSPFQIDGETYQAPDTFNDNEDHPCRIPAAILKVGSQWTLH